MPLSSVALKASCRLAPALSRIRQPAYTAAAAHADAAVRQFSAGRVARATAATKTLEVPTLPESTERRTSPPKPLPSLPPAPMYPAPLITQDELTQYLVPLYEREWRVAVQHGSTCLHRRIRLNKYKDVMDFATELAQCATSESHHPELTLTYAEVNIRLVTHSAVRRVLDQNDDPKRTEHIQGITLRDVRLAILAERLFAQFDEAGRIGKQPYPTGRTPYNVESFDYRRRSGRKCVVCNSQDHPSDRCPKRHSILPASPCVYCGGMHWRSLCPKHGKPQETQATQ